MRSIRGRALLQALPLKSAAQRSGFALLVGLAISLMIVSQVEPRTVEHLRTGITDVTAPVLGFLSRPAASVAEVAGEIDSIMAVHAENQRLLEENSRLLRWQSLASQLGSENETLRAMLKVVPDPQAHFITARVIGDAGGPFVRTLLVAAGEQQGVRKGQAVVTAEGLVGRVVEAGASSGRILLVTDLNSRIPVVISGSRHRAILAGNNTGSLRLEFLAVDARLGIGDRVVTSGEGGAFPPGLPIGRISRVGEDTFQVEPWVKWDRLEFVTVLDYSLPGILPATRRAGRAHMINSSGEGTP